MKPVRYTLLAMTALAATLSTAYADYDPDAQMLEGTVNASKIEVVLEDLDPNDGITPAITYMSTSANGSQNKAFSFFVVSSLFGSYDTGNNSVISQDHESEIAVETIFSKGKYTGSPVIFNQPLTSGGFLGGMSLQFKIPQAYSMQEMVQDVFFKLTPKTRARFKMPVTMSASKFANSEIMAMCTLYSGVGTMLINGSGQTYVNKEIKITDSFDGGPANFSDTYSGTLELVVDEVAGNQSRRVFARAGSSCN
ncbi:hypothetical protein [Parachitinimonas caeni]|uniref:Uncharacterized protein n=1 Tax=Parachitinimonas caeni TaxID=3031301 RepID=A0ABT7DUS6_9NEIS|nr:hypothetical protein [Parachitinimonas caeni]MDK2123734.1 hypothetical protein [Parachitinimonas caeni]